MQAPQEAILDSRLLVAVSNLGAAKARELKQAGGGFDTDDFIIKLVSFIGGNKTLSAPEGEDIEDEENIIELDWEKLGDGQFASRRRGIGLDVMQVSNFFETGVSAWYSITAAFQARAVDRASQETGSTYSRQSSAGAKCSSTTHTGKPSPELAQLLKLQSSPG